MTPDRNERISVALDSFQKARLALDRALKGVPGANKPLSEMRFLTDEIEQIANAVR